MALNIEIDNLGSYATQLSVVNENVSDKGVGWHVLHSLKVIHTILIQLQKSDPDLYKQEFNLLRTVLLTLGWIPRGGGKAPKIVQPADEEIRAGEIDALLSKVRNSMSILDSAPPGSYFKHPYFGMMNKKLAYRFLVVHTKHHLKIIRDIVG